MKVLNTTLVITLMGFMAVSCAQEKKDAKAVGESAAATTKMMAAEAPEAQTIVGVAASNDNFSTLVAAVKAADLVGTLSSDGPFTVFAPTNDAFAKLPEGTVENLLKPENKGDLTAILTYHVVAGSYDAAAVVDAINSNNGAFPVSTVNGGSITLSLNDGNVILTDAKGGTATVIIPDVDASNGLIHAIDAVVMP